MGLQENQGLSSEDSYRHNQWQLQEKEGGAGGADRPLLSVLSIQANGHPRS